MKPPSGSRHDAPTDRPDAAAVTVLAVDDQPIFLRAAHQLIADTPGFEQVGEATSGPEALEMAAAVHPDLVLLDVRMPGMDGIETARRMVALDAHAVVILVSLEEAPELPASLATVGAAVHLRKQDLSTRTLLDIWANSGDRARAGAICPHGRRPARSVIHEQRQPAPVGRRPPSARTGECTQRSSVAQRPPCAIDLNCAAILPNGCPGPQSAHASTSRVHSGG